MLLAIRRSLLFFVKKELSTMPGQMEDPLAKRATFGMGCFWAGDSLFGATPGVLRTRVGYAGGTQASPTYRNIFLSHLKVLHIDDETHFWLRLYGQYILKSKADVENQTKILIKNTFSGDHTEVIDIDYDPKVISYPELLNLFWNNHEYGLTTRIKRQYMSLILWHDEEQRSTAEKSRETEQRQRGEPLVTELKAFSQFYPAEDYHQKYRLQGHAWLMENLRLKKTGDDLMNSTIAAKLNGYLAGAASISQFENELPSLGLSEEAQEYVRKYVVENQGNGLYC